MTESREGRRRVTSCLRRAQRLGSRFGPRRPGRAPRGQGRHSRADLVLFVTWRVMTSPFTFYRRAAEIMAADLNDTPAAGLDVQLCGAAHITNFGAYASEGNLFFHPPDFDET